MRKPCAVLIAAAALAGCGSDTGAQGNRTLTVLAAASLTGSFGALERRFEADHPGIDVTISFQGSSALAQQIVNGARADVFASADEDNMSKVVDAGLAAGVPEVFATNRLTIAVAPGNPDRIASFADLARDGVVVVVCAPQVPCGAATQKVAKATGITLAPVSEEQDVKSVLNKVRAGEADAGLVYLTDVRSAGDTVTGVDFPESARAVNRYPIAALTEAPQAELARAFVELVRGETGRQELTEAGFGLP
jgi:molybdate transport system substrate-binding protein